MFITVGDNQYELSTKLGIGKKIEAAFRMPIMQVFFKLSEAEVDELIKIVAIAADKQTDKQFSADVYEEWDFIDLFNAVQEIVARLLFGGTPEQNEAKLAKFPAPEQQKNWIRGILGLPIPTVPGVPQENLQENLIG